MNTTANVGDLPLFTHLFDDNAPGEGNGRRDRSAGTGTPVAPDPSASDGTGRVPSALMPRLAG